MIEYKIGNVLTEEAEALVNTVNCVGVMGRGVALQFKRVFPENFKAYRIACRQGKVVPGHMFIFETNHLAGVRFIINFPTKRDWRGKSSIADIETGLKALVDEIKKREIHSIAIPPLGSGLGGLAWSDVRPRIEEAMQALPDVRVIVFEPQGDLDTSHTFLAPTTSPHMTHGRAALIVLMDRYLNARMDHFVTLLEAQKLMYLMQEAGEPLRLRYVKYFYGPYADNLGKVFQAMEGYWTSGYMAGDAPGTPITLLPGAIIESQAFLDMHVETQARFNRVIDLIQGFETQQGIELLATVHWIVKRMDAQTVADVISKTYEWGQRKRQFSKRQIILALETLAKKQWIPTTFAKPVLA